MSQVIAVFAGRGEAGVEIRPPEFDVWIRREESAGVRDALQGCGYPHVAQLFTGAYLHQMVQAWAIFVETDWTRWDLSEYNHDLTVRDHLEVVLVHLPGPSRERLGAVLAPLDDTFKARMRPIEADQSPDAYGRFWRVGTIWNGSR